MNPTLDDPTSASSGTPLPLGFTSDDLNSYYQSLINPIEATTQQNVQSAQTNAVARGLDGTATETGGMAGAQYYGDMAKANALGGLKFQMAGLSNQDALIGSQQNWQANQNQLNRQQQITLDQMGYGFKSSLMGQQNKYNVSSGLMGLGSSIAGSGIGALGEYAGLSSLA